MCICCQSSQDHWLTYLQWTTIGLLPVLTLHLDDLLYHSNNGLHVSALALWVPVLYVQLSHFVYRKKLFSVRLKETSMCSLVNSHIQTHCITCRLMIILRST